MRSVILAILLGISCFLVNVEAQEKPAWVAQLEQVLRKKEPKWKISEKDVQSVPGHFHEALILKSGTFRADIVITILASPERATKQFEGEKIAFSNIMAKDTAKSRLKGLGDENFMFTGKGRRKYGNIFIKQGNVLVKVFAPSVETAKRFAKYVADLIPPSNNSFNRNADWNVSHDCSIF